MNVLEKTWTIGIYTGETPFNLSPDKDIQNPVLSNKDITDVEAAFVADPFMLKHDGLWYMFFEVWNTQTNKGEIGFAISNDGFQWDYQKIVLNTPFHLSYPFVFSWEGEYYMIPETLATNSVRLYKASSFPEGWVFVKTLLKVYAADPSVFYFNEKWWMFLCSKPFQHDTLSLYMADHFPGPWTEHPASPVVKDNPSIARPAGMPVIVDGKLIRFAQDCIPDYGTQVRAFIISTLKEEIYIENEHTQSPVLSGTGKGWNGKGMHHLDAHQLADNQWIACVDGHFLKPKTQT